MTRAGVPPRAQKAGLDTIPSRIRNLSVFAHFPEKSFGFTGPGGCGKSCALAYLVGQSYLKDFRSFGPSRYEKNSGAMQGAQKIVSYTPSLDFIWINWPAKAVLMKQLASRRDWENREASLLPIMDAIKTNPERTVIVVDDFGMENIKGEKAYVQEQLELLIDTAYNWEARLFWTSNHAFESLAEDKLYGYRMMSRMAGLSPDIKLPEDLPDLRAQSAYAKT